MVPVWNLRAAKDTPPPNRPHFIDTVILGFSPRFGTCAADLQFEKFKHGNSFG
jgi:hypothetical protein